MPYPSLFAKMNVKAVKLADKVECEKTDKQHLIQIDNARAKAI